MGFHADLLRRMHSDPSPRLICYISDNTSDNMSHHYIQFDHVSYSYPGGTKALDDVSFRITHGEHVALLGLNGCGKSTLLLHINGLLMPTQGRVVIGDIPVTKKTLPVVRSTVGLVFQNPDDMLFMPTIGEDVAFGPRNMKLPEEEVERRVVKALSDVGLLELRDRPAFTLSGGQRRAAAIAAVLSMEPDILVLDEPSSNLDAKARRQLIDILHDFRHTFLIATHDLPLAQELCPRSLIMEQGHIVNDLPTGSLCELFFVSLQSQEKVHEGQPG